MQLLRKYPLTWPIGKKLLPNNIPTGCPNLIPATQHNGFFTATPDLLPTPCKWLLGAFLATAGLPRLMIPWNWLTTRKPGFHAPSSYPRIPTIMASFANLLSVVNPQHTHASPHFYLPPRKPT